MKDAKDLTEKIKLYAVTLGQSAAKHRFTLLFVILGLAVAFALYRTRIYLDIPRNETRYAEERVKIKYKKIDEDILASFKAAEDDKQIDVDADFDPTRENPFTEN